MQSPIAALTIPNCVGETAGSKHSVEPSDDSFVLTFVEAVLADEPHSRADDATMTDIVAPGSWPLVVSPKPALLATAETAFDQAKKLPSGHVESSGPLDLQHPGDIGVPALFMTPAPGREASTIDWSHYDASAGYPVSHLGIEFSLDSILAPDLQTGGPDLPLSQMRIDIGSMISAHAHDDLAPLAEVDARALSFRGDAEVQEGTGPSQFNASHSARHAGVVLTQMNDAGVHFLQESGSTTEPKKPPSGRLEQPETPDGKQGRSSVHPLFHRQQRVGDGARPLTWQMEWPDAGEVEASAASTYKDPSGERLGPDLSAGASTDLPSVQASSPSLDPGDDPQPIPTSIWERHFSERIASSQDKIQSTLPLVVASDTTSVLASEMIPVALDTAGRRTAIMPTSETVQAVGSNLNDGPPDLHAALTIPVTPVQGTDAFGWAIAGLVVSGWDDDHLQADQGANISQSFGLTHATRNASGTLASPFGLPTLSVPQVASQLTSALIRNTDGIAELALAPEELGRVRLRMEPDSANPDRLLILISVERPETLDLFRRHANELADAIRCAGYSDADIGFGQEDRNGRSKHENKSSSGEASLPREEGAHFELGRPMPVGTSLDLRL